MGHSGTYAVTHVVVSLELTILRQFEKFLIDKEGKVVDRYASTTKPESIEPAIEKLLSA